MAFLGIHIVSDREYKLMKAAYDQTPSGVVDKLAGYGANEVTKLISIVKERFPALTEAFHQGFIDMNNTSLKGFAKMEAVVADILVRLPQLVPELLSLKNIKDFLLQLGQTLFNDIFVDLGDFAADLLKKLL